MGMENGEDKENKLLRYKSGTVLFCSNFENAIEQAKEYIKNNDLDKNCVKLVRVDNEYMVKRR